MTVLNACGIQTKGLDRRPQGAFPFRYGKAPGLGMRLSKTGETIHAFGISCLAGGDLEEKNELISLHT